MQAVAEQAAQSIDTTTLANSNDDLAKTISASLQQSMQAATQGLAKQQGLTSKFAEQVVTQSHSGYHPWNRNSTKHSEIKQKVAEIEYQKTIAEAQSEPPEVAQAKIEEAKVEYEAKQQKIAEEFKQQVVETVTTKSQELAQQATQTILEKAEEKKKNNVEDDDGAVARFCSNNPFIFNGVWYAWYDACQFRYDNQGWGV